MSFAVCFVQQTSQLVTVVKNGAVCALQASEINPIEFEILRTFQYWHHNVYYNVCRSSDCKSLICDANKMCFYDGLIM